MARIGIFGAGWVGLVTGVCLADLGHDVAIRDVVPERIDALLSGTVPFHETEVPELLERNNDRLTFTLDAGEIAGCELVFVCVDTPPTPSGDADLSRVWSVVEELPALDGQPVLVMKSTVPVGTGQKVRAGLDARGLAHVGYVSNPEFLSEGRAVEEFLHPDRVVIGAFDAADGDAVAALYEPLGAPIVRCDVNSAEMIKLAANAFLMTRISFINEIANVCEATGADVVKVAEGVGLDHRLGPHFLRAGIGYGGSCLAGRETVLVRLAGRTWLTSLERLHDALHGQPALPLEVLAWRESGGAPRFLPVAAVTRRDFDGEIVEVRTSMGRRLRCTPDHPFVTDAGLALASELSGDHWLPLALGRSADEASASPPRGALAPVAAAAGSREDDVVRPAEAVAALAPDDGRPLRPGAAAGGASAPAGVPADERFWRVVGLYIAAGHCVADGTSRRLCWTFHAADQQDLADEVLDYWRSLGVEGVARRTPATTIVSVSSRFLADWWLGTLGLGAIAHDHRIPDPAWTAPDSHKRALLDGLSRGGCPDETRAAFRYPATSPGLVDGIVRLLADVGIVARVDAHGLTATSADRRDERGAWARVLETRRRPFRGFVYSLEVPEAHTFVTTGGLVVHNCFPKDSLALKQLASNSGYHFQLLSAVIEVNELQKRRVIGKLKQHLGALSGRRVALLGLAFKPHTDDMREAPSIVLAARLLAEGAEVRAWDPVADGATLPGGVEIVGSVLEAVRGADAAVVVTEWPELRELAREEVRVAMANPLLVDGRNLLDPAAVRAAGFVYEGIGRPAPPEEVPDPRSRALAAELER
jgi:UDPglucose 6-dehydrogenase